MTHEGALFKTIEKLLNDDAYIKAHSKGAHPLNAPKEVSMPYLVYRSTGELRCNTLAGEATRSMFLRVKTHWGQSTGANYGLGDALESRVISLLDGKSRDENRKQRMPDVLAGINAIMAPTGYKCIYSALETSLPTQGDTVPPNLIPSSYSRGGIFHIQLRLLEPGED